MGQRLRARFWIAPSYHAKGHFAGNQHVTLPSTDRLRDFPLHISILPPCIVPIPCIIAEKPLKMPFFSKTGSRNMAKICAINFSTLFSYSTSIVIWALRRLLLPFLIRAGPDFENLEQNRQSPVFAFLSNIWSPFTEKIDNLEKQFSAVW